MLGRICIHKIEGCTYFYSSRSAHCSKNVKNRIKSNRRVRVRLLHPVLRGQYNNTKRLVPLVLPITGSSFNKSNMSNLNPNATEWSPHGTIAQEAFDEHLRRNQRRNNLDDFVMYRSIFPLEDHSQFLYDRLHHGLSARHRALTNPVQQGFVTPEIFDRTKAPSNIRRMVR